MFDNPYEYPPRKAGPHVNPRATAGIGVVLLALALAAAGAQAFPRAEAQIVTSPAQLRQVEIIAGPTQTAFYLHSAGYRLRHQRQLIALVAGGGAWRVTWPTANALRITFTHPWSHLTQGHPQGITVTFTAAR
jgi:hypothetical protein